MSNKDLYNYVIFKYDVGDSDFYLFNSAECPAIGFSSLYSYTRETAETFEKAGFKAYKGIVWSEALAVDFDTEEAATSATERLTSLGLKFEVWSTGNRGKHIYIDRPHAPSHILPKIDKEWVVENLPGADLSIYHNVAMFRRPGARHSKTGERKVLLQKYNGTPLLLPDTLASIEVPEFKGKRTSSSLFTDALVMSLTVPQSDGKRHETLLHLGLALKRKGEPQEFIYRWLYHTNLLFNEPKSTEELERIMIFIDQAAVDNEQA